VHSRIVWCVLLLLWWVMAAAVARISPPRFSPRRDWSSDQFRRAGGGWCSWCGRWCEGGGRRLELLSPALFFVVVELLLARRRRCWGCAGVGLELADGLFWCLYRSPVVLQFVPKLLCVQMQVGVLALASFSVLTAGVNRGVSPADVLSASFRSRRPRRVAAAATSTRRGPLKVRSGDLAAACGGFVSPSGEVELSKMAVADLHRLRGARGLDCFLVSFRVLFVIWGQLSQCLVGSCIVFFPYLI
jgi:hypothetical protein